MRKSIVAFHNARQDAMFDTATRLHTQLKQGSREDRKVPLRDRLNRLMEVQRISWDDRWRIAGVLIKEDRSTGKVSLKAPLKKEFQHAKANTQDFSYGEASLRFEPKTRTVHWTVPESKGAVDEAWGSPLGKAFQAALGRVNWTRGTGGHFRYSDEYMQDADHDYAGGRLTHFPALRAVGRKGLRAGHRDQPQNAQGGAPALALTPCEWTGGA